jgi:hypothetical protein
MASSASYLKSHMRAVDLLMGGTVFIDPIHISLSEASRVINEQQETDNSNNNLTDTVNYCSTATSSLSYLFAHTVTRKATVQ